MKTQKVLLEEHRAKLDEAFHRKYPDGKFAIQYRADMGIKVPFWLMHWEPSRRTAHDAPRAISVEFRDDVIRHQRFQSSSFGKVNNYNSLEKLLAATERQGVPATLVDAFLERYINREREGFVVRKE